MGVKPKVPLEEQIDVLASCGIALNPGVTVHDLLKSFNRDTYETDPYMPLLAMMGSPLECPTEGAREQLASNNVWHMDTECIYDIGDYSYIAERINIITGDVLQLEDISDQFYKPLPFARLSFRLRNKKFNWYFFLRGDWIDTRIFTKFQKLIKNQNTVKSLCSLDTGGSDLIFGFLSPTQQNKFNKLTGLNFEE